MGGKNVEDNVVSVAYSEAGAVHLLTSSGQLAKTIKISASIRDFAISPDGKRLIFTNADRTAYGGLLYQLIISSGSVQELPHRLENHSEVYADPEFSTDGSDVAFAIHGQAHGDLVEASGPIGVLDLEKGQISVLEATKKIDGDLPAFANEPHWAPDGSSILFNFETGAALVDAKGEKLRDITSQMESSDDEWSHALGWLGSKCVVYIAGKNQEDANRKSPRILNLSTETTMLAAKYIGVPEKSLIGLNAFSSNSWIRVTSNQIYVASKKGEWEIPVKSAQNIFVRFVPKHEQPADTIPPSCR